MRPSLWFVQPVHGRAGLARLCMEQRRRMLDELAGLGVDAQMVVVGNDANLDTARELGFATLERPNVLGAKVNDGIEYACREGGADYVSFIGSDDWSLASWFVTMPPDGLIKTSRWVAFVAPGGNRLLVRAATGSVGNAPWIIPRSLLEPAGFRPVLDRKMSGIDGSIRDGIIACLRGVEGTTGAQKRMATRQRLADVYHHEPGDELRLVDFKGSREQITSYSLALGKPRRLVHDEPDPWPVLATRYPADLVGRMERLYAERTFDA